MTLDLFTIGVMCGLAVAYHLVVPARWRGWALLVGSLVAIFLLQPSVPLRNAAFLYPAATALLAVVGWYATRKPDDEDQQATQREDWISLAVIVAIVVGLSFHRYIDRDYWILPAQPPEPLWIAAGFAVVLVPMMLSGRLIYRFQWRVLLALTLFIIGLFVVFKTPPLIEAASRFGRALNNQDTSLAEPLDLNWLGFSYVAFRVIHTLRDRQSGILPALSLQEYVTYIIFAPAYIAGPIDRAERFQQDLQALPEMKRFDANRFTVAGGRIAVGMFKKFVIADTLAVALALNPELAMATDSAAWMWVLVYGYALRLFFDFSGYTDIAIGIGILFGIRLPENFNRPYLKTDITAFWQSWHITLSNWARFYVFTPISRGLLRRKPRPNPVLIVLLGHLATMITIGLWHGVIWNFFIWGLWHAAGLFIHKMWSDRTRKWYRGLKQKPWQLRLWTAFAWFITFHFVVLGWVWFALPDVSDSLRVFGALFGVY